MRVEYQQDFQGIIAIIEIARKFGRNKRSIFYQNIFIFNLYLKNYKIKMLPTQKLVPPNTLSNPQL